MERGFRQDLQDGGNGTSGTTGTSGTVADVASVAVVPCGVLRGRGAGGARPSPPLPVLHGQYRAGGRGLPPLPLGRHTVTKTESCQSCLKHPQSTFSTFPTRLIPHSCPRLRLAFRLFSTAAMFVIRDFWHFLLTYKFFLRKCKKNRSKIFLLVSIYIEGLAFRRPRNNERKEKKDDGT